MIPQERKREEAAAKKAEARRLAAEEEAALANAGKKKQPQKVGSSKVGEGLVPAHGACQAVVMVGWMPGGLSADRADLKAYATTSVILLASVYAFQRSKTVTCDATACVAG